MAEVQDYRNSLTLNSMLLEYRLESVLGAGGFGMTYLGWDTNLEKKVAIKEYLPVELAVRALDGSVVPISTGTAHNYKWGLERFLQEARLLAKFNHPNIVVVNRYFEANGTAYMVMNYVSGVSFNQLLKANPQPDEQMLTGILLPLLDGLHAVHDEGFLHRDIKPSNIFIRDSGAPLLIDFGSARLAISGATRTMTSVLTPGYAPLEQYSNDGDQGPWTDIYSMAAVMYRAVIGDNPPDVVTRLKNDGVTQSLMARRERFTPGFLQAVGRGMAVDEKKRPQSVPEWKSMFTGGEFVAPKPFRPLPSEVPPPVDRAIAEALTQRPAVPVSATTRKRAWVTQLTWFAAGTLALFLVIGGEQIFEKTNGKGRAKSGSASETKSSTAPGTVQPRKLTPREFYLLDRDSNGYLTREEVKGDAFLEQNFATIDANRDDRISLEEFTSFP